MIMHIYIYIYICLSLSLSLYIYVYIYDVQEGALEEAERHPNQAVAEEDDAFLHYNYLYNDNNV